MHKKSKKKHQIHMHNIISVSKNLSCIFYVSIPVYTGCVGAGTHGSIKGYRYTAMKDSLQKAVITVIQNNPNIYRDTSLDRLGSSPLLDSKDGGITVQAKIIIMT